MAGEGSETTYTPERSAPMPRGNGMQKPVLEKTKSVNYSATQSDQILSVSGSASSSTTESIPRRVEVVNTGRVPLMIMAGYESYTYNDDTVDTDVVYLHSMLLPNETYYPPIRAIAKTHASSDMTVIVDGTVVDNATPSSDMYVEFSDGVADIDSATAAGIVGNATNTTVYLEPYTSAANCAANNFRVGDLIRVRNEVMEVTAIGDKSDLENNALTVKRDMYGTDGGTSAVDNDSVRLPFFNAYHDYDRYSLAQTDSDGKFKAMNFFALGRTSTTVQGITPGSVSLKFYEAGYQSLGLSGITGNTHSGLAASTDYKIDITVDGGSLFQDLTFTTDATNLNFGGSNGIISKIQTALDTQFYTAGNLFEKKVHVGIVNGDVRFTSGSHLSTSAILLADTGDSGSFIDAAANGRIPASANIPSAVAAKLPDDVTYDRVTYSTSANSSAFVYDDGSGNLFGAATGTINYETGAIDLRDAPINAEFVISCMHTGAFSGKLNEAETDRINSLIAVYANTTSTKGSGKVTVRTF